MPHIVLTPEQAKIVDEATHPVEVRTEQGKILARILSPADAAILAEAKRRRMATETVRYSPAEVRARLARLEEISRREPLDREKVMELLRRMRAGEEV